MEKDRYEALVMEVIEFETEDVIVTSGDHPNDDGNTKETGIPF